MATLNFKLAPQKNKVGRYIIRLHIVAGSSNTAVNTNISIEKKSDWLEKQQKVRLNPKANEILSEMMRHYQDILLALEQSGKLKGMKAKEIAEGMFISSRAVSGAMRKLVTDGFVEKVGQDPVIYSITEKGKNIKIED